MGWSPKADYRGEVWFREIGRPFACNFPWEGTVPRAVLRPVGVLRLAKCSIGYLGHHLSLSVGSSDFLHLEQPSDVGKRNKVFVAKALDAYRIHRLGPLSGLWFLIHWEAESAASAVD